jgi:phosphoribosylformimino-5-aminoimidazole carboxamide ribotide isomerase
MQIIPVFDLKDGILVHAIGGTRRDYQPLHTPLIPSPDPRQAVEILVNLGFRRLYIADLNAITQSGSNSELVRELVGSYPIEVWLDAGLRGATGLPLCDLSQVSLIAGSETVATLADLAAICDEVGAGRVIFSLDTNNGEVLTPDHALKGIAPVKLAAQACAQGIEKMIVLDLKAVGSRAGLNRDLLCDLVRNFPGKSIFPGGGFRDEDLEELKRIGVRGVLTATALYSKQIPVTPEI